MRLEVEITIKIDFVQPIKHSAAAGTPKNLIL